MTDKAVKQPDAKIRMFYGEAVNGIGASQLDSGGAAPRPLADESKEPLGSPAPLLT